MVRIVLRGALLNDLTKEEVPLKRIREMGGQVHLRKGDGADIIASSVLGAFLKFTKGALKAIE